MIKAYTTIAEEIIKQVKKPKIEKVKLENAIGRVVAQNIKAAEDIPLFDRSPYDGYCFIASDTKNANKKNLVKLKIIDNIHASQVSKKALKSGECIRLMTGTKIAKNANCIVKYEDVIEEEGYIKLDREYKEHSNVIYRGEELKKGEIVVEKGTVISYNNIGILASLNINEIAVYEKIKINFISTGSELLEVGDSKKDGKIFNTNRWTIISYLNKCGFEVKYLGIVGDDYEKLKNKISKSIEEADVTITTGGASVGDYDLINKILKDIKANIIAESTNLKPGMACNYAIKNKKIFIGLSGNPMAAFCNLLMIGLKIIKKMQGYTNYENEIVDVELDNNLEYKNIDSTRIVIGKTYIRNGKIMANVKPKQGNSILTSLSSSDIAIIIDANAKNIHKNNIIKGIIL